jgi:hypothetical protein
MKKIVMKQTMKQTKRISDDSRNMQRRKRDALGLGPATTDPHSLRRMAP